MEAVRQYLISITAAAMICSIVPSFFPEKSPYKSILKLLCGLMFTVVLISPWRDFTIGNYESFFNSLALDAEAFSESGQTHYNESMAAGIKKRTEAYILDKANAYNLDLKVQVELTHSTPPVPETIVIFGSVSPLQRNQLTASLSGDLGIPKENILWQSNQ